ncbi:hypothetical protein NPIL_17251 [Nephila pilipes]|uniref:Uncharacterized protein n=1 Tax=Nephila pilipes TaxID=299642 RepID=A0A8X6TWN2_NEPPI|nr:hypothetical protein NPIL_17251 [Nephila pilipes]
MSIRHRLIGLERAEQLGERERPEAGQSVIQVTIAMSLSKSEFFSKKGRRKYTEKNMQMINSWRLVTDYMELWRIEKEYPEGEEI